MGLENEDGALTADSVDKWLRERSHAKITLGLEVLSNDNPDVAVSRNMEGRVKVIITNETGIRQITLSRRNRSSPDLILESELISSESGAAKVYGNTYIVSSANNKFSISQARVISSDKLFDTGTLFRKIKVALEMLRLWQDTSPSEREKFRDKVRDYSRDDDGVALNLMLDHFSGISLASI